jgi:transposase
VEKQGQYLTPFQRKLLHKSLKADLRLEYRRRIEIMLLADEGHSQTQICDALGCSYETARYWIAIAQTGKAHLWDDRPMGRPKVVNEQYLDRLRELVNQDPRECGYSFKRWTGEWLAKHLNKELDIQISACHVNRLLKQMGLSTRRSAANETKEQPANPENSHLTIRDLTNVVETESSSLWLFHSMR